MDWSRIWTHLESRWVLFESVSKVNKQVLLDTKIKLGRLLWFYLLVSGHVLLSWWTWFSWIRFDSLLHWHLFYWSLIFHWISLNFIVWIFEAPEVERQYNIHLCSLIIAISFCSSSSFSNSIRCNPARPNANLQIARRTFFVTKRLIASERANWSGPTNRLHLAHSLSEKPNWHGVDRA